MLLIPNPGYKQKHDELEVEFELQGAKLIKNDLIIADQRNNIIFLKDDALHLLFVKEPSKINPENQITYLLKIYQEFIFDKNKISLFEEFKQKISELNLNNDISYLFLHIINEKGIKSFKEPFISNRTAIQKTNEGQEESINNESKQNLDIDNDEFETEDDLTDNVQSSSDYVSFSEIINSLQDKLKETLICKGFNVKESFYNKSKNKKIRYQSFYPQKIYIKKGLIQRIGFSLYNTQYILGGQKDFNDPKNLIIGETKRDKQIFSKIDLTKFPDVNDLVDLLVQAEENFIKKK